MPADDAVHLDADDILATATVHDLVIGSRLAFEDRGTHMLKGIDTPWPIVAAIANRDPPTHAP